MQILKDEIKGNIIAAAILEFGEQGYEKASMRAIAKTAGISVSNVYNYYPNKEQLFNSIIEPVFKRVKGIFQDSLEESAKNSVLKNDFQSFINPVVDSLVRLGDRERQLLIILVEKSEGTRFENSREEMVKLLKMHLAEVVNCSVRSVKSEDKRAYILDIIASNYIAGVLRILKDYRDPEWAESNLKTLLTYHLNGIKGLV